MPMKRKLLCLVVVTALLAGCAQAAPSSVIELQNGTVSVNAEPSSNAPQGTSSSSSAGISAEPTETPQSSSGQGVDTVSVTVTLPEDISMVVNGVTVTVNPMTEMLSVIQYLSDYDKQFPLMTDVKTTYHDDIDLAFGRYKEHDAVKFFNEAMKHGFSYDSPPTACLYLNKDFSVSDTYADSDYAKNRMSTDMNRFRDVMEQFCIDTNFTEFFEAHKDFYNLILERYEEDFPKWDVIKTMEDYYGQAMASYNIVLVPLFHGGGFATSVNRADGNHIYSFGGPTGSGYSRKFRTVPEFGNENSIAYLITHEFGHSFIPINALDNTAMVGEVKRSEYLMKPIKERMASSAYPTWSVAYEELVLRAAVIDIAVRNTGGSPGQALQREQKKGFIYIESVYEVLKQYSENRDKYPTFVLFVPVITDYLLEKHPKQ